MPNSNVRHLTYMTNENMPTLNSLFAKSETKERWGDTQLWLEKEERADEALRKKADILHLDHKVRLNEHLDHLKTLRDELVSNNNRQSTLLYASSVMTLLTVIGLISNHI